MLISHLITWWLALTFYDLYVPIKLYQQFPNANQLMNTNPSTSVSLWWNFQDLAYSESRRSVALDRWWEGRAAESTLVTSTFSLLLWPSSAKHMIQSHLQDVVLSHCPCQVQHWGRQLLRWPPMLPTCSYSYSCVVRSPTVPELVWVSYFKNAISVLSALLAPSPIFGS